MAADKWSPDEPAEMHQVAPTNAEKAHIAKRAELEKGVAYLKGLSNAEID